MNYQYKVGDLFIYNGKYEEFHGKVGQVVHVRQSSYSCVLLTDLPLPFNNWSLVENKMLPYKFDKTPDWEV